MQNCLSVLPLYIPLKIICSSHCNPHSLYLREFHWTIVVVSTKFCCFQLHILLTSQRTQSSLLRFTIRHIPPFVNINYFTNQWKILPSKVSSALKIRNNSWSVIPMICALCNSGFSEIPLKLFSNSIFAWNCKSVYTKFFTSVGKAGSIG